MSGLPELDEYTLDRRLFTSDALEVFLARRRRGGGLFEVKIFKPGALDPVGREALAREAKRAARLLHPNLVQVVDHGELEGRPWLVTEHPEALSLSAFQERCLQREELPPVEVCVDVGVQLCRALSTLHEADGEGHGGVTAAAVWLRDDGCVRLSEAVLSRIEPRDGAPLPREDQRAAARLLFEMLTARAPGEGTAVPSRLRKSVPSAVDAVIARALAASDAGYEDMAALLSALEACVPPLGVDDRESRLRAELARASPSAAKPPPAREAGAAGASDASPGVDSSLEPEMRELSPILMSRAIELEGDVRAAPRSAPALEKKRARKLAWAAALVIALVLIVLAAPPLTRALQGGQTEPAAQERLEVRRGADAPAQDVTSRTEATRKPRPDEERRATALERAAAEHLLAGRNVEALKLLKQAAALAPQRASLQRKLAMAYESLVEPERAAAHLERYLELSPKAEDRASVNARLEELRRAR